MFSQPISIKVRLMITLVAIIAVVIVAVALAPSGAVATPLAAAKSQCEKVEGEFTLQPVLEPDCLSPVDQCATGTYKGSIKGTNVFTGSSVIQTVDTPTTGVILLTGDNVIQTRNGALITKDAITLHTGTGKFAEVDTIVGGTGEWAGVTGVLQAVGTFTDAGGEGRYTGEICPVN